MKSPVFSQWRGTVTVVVRGEAIESFINELYRQGIRIWDLVALPDGKMEMNLQVADFFSLRPLLKRTGCRLRIKKRSGLPFTLARLWQRKWFGIGFAVFLAVVFSLSQLVWDIEIKGNVKILDEDVLKVAREERLYPFQWIFSLPEQDKLSAELNRKLPGTSWVGVSRTGTKISIQIVEATQPKEQGLASPRHLVSKADAIITYIYAEKGQPEVNKNDRVRKGQILVSGIQGGKAVVSKGEVKGNVWHEYNIEVPLLRRQKAYTGEKKERGYLFFGKTAIQLSGYGKVNFDHSQMLTEFNPLTWRSIKLPIGWMSEKILETTELEIKLSKNQAVNDGIERARRDILAKHGANSVILNQKILHEKTDNGKVYMKVLFEVEQNIAEELPIVYDQGE